MGDVELLDGELGVVAASLDLRAGFGGHAYMDITEQGVNMFKKMNDPMLTDL